MALESRARELAHKLVHDENKHLRKSVLSWIDESKAWAEKICPKAGKTDMSDVNGTRLRYILNHLCPSLHHFWPNLSLMECHGDIETYNKLAMAHMSENTQVGIAGIQRGVEYDTENLIAFVEEALPFTSIGEAVKTAKENGWTVKVTDDARLSFTYGESDNGFSVIVRPSKVSHDIIEFAKTHADDDALTKKVHMLESYFAA